MKAALLTALGAFEVREQEAPRVEAGGVRLRVERREGMKVVIATGARGG